MACTCSEMSGFKMRGTCSLASAVHRAEVHALCLAGQTTPLLGAQPRPLPCICLFTYTGLLSVERESQSGPVRARVISLL